MTSEECFEAAVQVENLMKDIYVRLADRFAADARLKELFLRLAEEEEQHASRIRLLAKHQTEGTWAQETAQRISKDLNEMAAELVAMVADLEEDWNTRSSREILRQVMDVERRCSVVHAEELAQSAEIDVQVLFWALARQDVHHKTLLEKALAS